MKPNVLTNNMLVQKKHKDLLIIRTMNLKSVNKTIVQMNMLIMLIIMMSILIIVF